MDTPNYIHSLLLLVMDSWSVPTWGLLWRKLLWAFSNSLFMDICFHLSWVHSGMELLSFMVFVCLTLWGTAKLFSSTVEQFYIPSSSMSVLIVCILTNTFHHPSFGMWSSISLWFCNRAYWPYVYLLWRNVYSGPLPFKVRLLVFLLLSCKCYLYVPDTRPLSDK